MFNFVEIALKSITFCFKYLLLYGKSLNAIKTKLLILFMFYILGISLNLLLTNTLHESIKIDIDKCVYPLSSFQFSLCFCITRPSLISWNDLQLLFLFLNPSYNACVK